MMCTHADRWPRLTIMAGRACMNQGTVCGGVCLGRFEVQLVLPSLTHVCHPPPLVLLPLISHLFTPQCKYNLINIHAISKFYILLLETPCPSVRPSVGWLVCHVFYTI